MTDAGPDSIWSGTYSRQPHGFWLDHRVRLAGERAGTLLLQMSDFCDVNRTDGVVADAQLNLFGSARGRQKALEALADVGLVSRVDIPPGWMLAGWLDGHRSKEQWTKLTAERRKAGSRGGKSARSPKPKEAPPAPPPAPAEPGNIEAFVEQLASGRLDPAAAQHSSTQRSEEAATAAGSRGRAVATATAAALERLGLGVADVAGAGLPEAIDRAMVIGWTLEGIAAKAAAARAKQYPLSWLLAALEQGTDRAASARF